MPQMYLIPAPIGAQYGIVPHPQWSQLRYFFVENAKTARAHLKFICPDLPLAECQFFVVDEHTNQAACVRFCEQLEGRDAGILSEAGMPCVADPGRWVVAWAHKHQYNLCPWPGPSAMMMALSASGLNGQRFAFHGYLPRDMKKRQELLKRLEDVSKCEHMTQIMIEVPHHNESLFKDFCAVLKPDTRLCVAINLMQPDMIIQMLSIRDWSERPLLPMHKKPAVFLFQSQNSEVS